MDDLTFQLPPEFKSWFGIRAKISFGANGTVALYTDEGHRRVVDRLRELSPQISSAEDVQAFEKFMLIGVFPCEIDMEGRLNLPGSLRDYLGTPGEIVVGGEGMIIIKSAKAYENIQPSSLAALKLLPEYGFLFGQKVVAARGPNNSIYFYTLADFQELNRQIDQNTTKYGFTYPEFKRSVAAGTFELVVGEQGELALPDSLTTHLSTQGELKFKQGTKWLELRRIHAQSCHCDDPKCAKCLKGGCQDPECSTHCAEIKKLYR